MKQIIIDSERNRILDLADSCLAKQPINIGDCPAPLSVGGVNDYFSQGDYWWPNPDTEDHLPWIRRDGETNPDNFDDHRILLRRMRKIVCALASAYKITSDEKYSEKAIQFLEGWFVSPKTRMNPSLYYSQVSLGHYENGGRSFGIIDTLHLIEIPLAINALEKSKYMGKKLYIELISWFNSYLDFMVNSELGITERNYGNNHGVAWHVQATLYAKFTGQKDILDQCRTQFKEEYLEKQLASDGTFPEEIARTKPYNYSLFIMDLMAILAYELSTPQDDLFKFKTKSGKSYQDALEFIFPVTKDKTLWSYHKDVEHFESYPNRQVYLLLTAIHNKNQELLDVWMNFDPEPSDIEVRRNLAMRQPVLWF